MSLLTGTDIANRLFVPRGRVAMWAQRGTGGFPSPIAYTLARAPLWDESSVLAWWEGYDPNARRGGKRGNKGNRDAVPPKRKRQMRATKTREVAKAAKQQPADLRARMMDRRFR